MIYNFILNKKVLGKKLQWFVWNQLRIFNNWYFRYKSNDDIYIENLFHPPIIVDLVWKTLITNSKIYKEYCYELCGGFIDRVDPLIMDNICELYNNFLIEIF